MLPFDTTRQLVVTEIPSRLVDRTTERGRQSHPILDERVRTAASAIGHRNPQVSACWSAWAAMTGAKPFTSGLTSPPELPGAGPRHTSPNRCLVRLPSSGCPRQAALVRLPRLLQIEVGRPPAHLCDDQVRGGLGDGVDAGDVGW